AKGYAAISSPQPGENVGADDIDAFNQGVAAGEESARTGIEMGDPCVPALEEHGPGHVPGMVINAAEIAHGFWKARQLATLGGGIAGIMVALIELACSSPVHTLPPDEVLPTLGQPVVDTLASYGLTSLQLFSESPLRQPRQCRGDRPATRGARGRR